MKNSARYLLLGMLLLARSVAAQTVEEAEAPTAAALLEEMEKTYAAVQSYADKSSALYRNRDESERLQVEFQIWFERPSNFRVDAESKTPGSTDTRREVLWADGVITRSWSTDKPVANLPKVQIARSGMFGTYAYHVPTLLDSNYGSRRLNELSEPQLAGEEVFEEVDCHLIRGKWDGDTYEVWLGKEDHLVHKIMATYADHTLEEIHREITIDQPIAKDVFRFAPEKEALPKKPKETKP